MAFSEDDGVDMADSSEENWDDDDDAIDTTESDQDFYLAIKPQSSQSVFVFSLYLFFSLMNVLC